jgi:hypothetical protein
VNVASDPFEPSRQLSANISRETEEFREGRASFDLPKSIKQTHIPLEGVCLITKLSVEV